MISRHFVRSLVGAAAMAFGALPLQADVITGLYGTGFGSSGNLLPEGSVDPHYKLTMTQDGYGPNAFVTMTDGFPIPQAWVPNSKAGDAGPKAQWIEPVSGTTDTHAPGNYVYETHFSLTGYDPTTAKLQLTTAVDNQLTNVLVNGKSTGISYDRFDVKSGVFSITDPSLFKSGDNTLDFLVHNDPTYAGDTQNPTGLWAAVSGSADLSAVPEPSSIILCGVVGLGAFGWSRLRRKALVASPTCVATIA